LHTGSYEDEPLDSELEESLDEREFTSEEVEECNFVFQDWDEYDESQKTTAEIFSIPNKVTLKNHMARLLLRMLTTTMQHPDSQECNEGPDMEERVGEKRPFLEILHKVAQSASTKPIENETTGKSTEISKMLTQEMNFLEKTKTLGPHLQKIYNMLITIKSSSVESERAFSSSAHIVTKIRCRLQDRTLDLLCFLRSLIRNSKGSNIQID
jgi:hAT family C-terminal dimerisation region